MTHEQFLALKEWVEAMAEEKACRALGRDCLDEIVATHEAEKIVRAEFEVKG